MPLGLALKQLVPTFVEPPLSNPIDVYFNSTTGKVWVADYGLSSTIPVYGDTIYDSTVPIVNLNNQFGSFNGPRRIIGDANNVYVTNGPRYGSSPVTNANQCAIISQTSGQIVGIVQVADIFFPYNSTYYPAYALDQAVNGDNLYIIASGLSLGFCYIQRFSISAVLAAYPSIVSTPVSTSSINTAQCLAYDPVTNQIFCMGPGSDNAELTTTPGGWYVNGGSGNTVTTTTPVDFYNGSYVTLNLNGTGLSITGPGGGPYLYADYASITPGGTSISFPGATVTGSASTDGFASVSQFYTMWALDPTTLVTNQNYAYTNTNNISVYSPINMIAGFNYIWVSLFGSQCDSTGPSFGNNNGVILRVDPSTFPANGSSLGTGPLIGPSTATATLNADTIGNTIIVGEQLLSESVQYVYRIDASTGTIASTITLNGYEVITQAGVNTPGGIWLMSNGSGILVYSNTIGSETQTHQILTY